MVIQPGCCGYTARVLWLYSQGAVVITAGVLWLYSQGAVVITAGVLWLYSRGAVGLQPVCCSNTKCCGYTAKML